MSGMRYMPFFVSEYLADTGHLSTLAHGAYMLLLMHHWCNGKLPDDDDQLARIARLRPYEWRRIVHAIRGFFTPDGHGGLIQKRLSAELEKANILRSRRALLGRAGGHAKSLKSKEAGLAIATHIDHTVDIDVESTERGSVPSPHSVLAARSPSAPLPLSSEPNGSSDKYVTSSEAEGKNQKTDLFGQPPATVNGKHHKPAAKAKFRHADYSKDAEFMGVRADAPWLKGHDGDAYAVWLRMSENDRLMASLGAAEYARDLERRRRPDYDPAMQFVRFLRNREWETWVSDEDRKIFCDD